MQHDKPPIMIFNGTKISYLSFRNIRFVDSLNFLPMALEKFSDTFDIREQKKGFFPHLFNKKENFNYIGEWPDQKYYNSEFFSVKKKQMFDKWYVENQHLRFDFKKELEDYCKSDVRLLMEGCLKFSSIIKDISGIEPFSQVITLASLTALIYRKNMMESHSIGIIPPRGYNAEEKQSKEALMWLKFLIHTKQYDHIRHAKNGGEVRIGPYRLDGYNETTNTFFEFHGCFFHGCPKCYNQRKFSTWHQEFWKNVHEKHNTRIQDLKKLFKHQYPGSNFVEIWGCEFNDMKKTNNDLKIFMIEKNILDAINPRDALYGGRTNALRLYHKISEGEKIMYVDFCSLYPAVMYDEAFPLKHPKIITENFADITTYFGLIMCDVLPPQTLFHPVLPSKIKDKLLFTLCHKCAVNESKNCDHAIKDRMLRGTWVSEELKVAVAEGYEILRIYEVWHYEERTQYDRVTKTGGLFAKQIKLLLKYKQEASGIPEGMDDNQLDEFIEMFYLKQGKLKY